MTGLPTGSVFLDDGSGTYPLDISDYVELDQRVTITGYGRTDEFTQAQSAQLTLTLNNSDGVFTSGTGFDTVGFDEDPFGGTIPIGSGTGIRCIWTLGATTRNRFTGKVVSAALGWPGGGESLSYLAVTAMDPLTDLAGRTMRSMLEEQILLDGPAAYYTLGEAEGTTTAGDTSGNQAPVLTMTGSGTAVGFGQGTGPTDGMTAATFAGGQYLTGGPVPTTHTQLVAFSRSGAPATNEVIAAANNEMLIVDTSGHLAIAKPGLVTPTIVVSTSTSVCDGDVHLVGWSSAAGSGFTLIADGTSTFAADTDAGNLSTASLTLGDQPNLILIGAPAALTGTLSHAATFDRVLTSAETLDVYNVLSGASESVHNRMQRLAGYTGVIFNGVDLTGDPFGFGPDPQMVGAQVTSGKSALDAMQEVATAEGGILYANGSGTIVLQGRGYRALKTSPDLTLDPADMSSDTGVTNDNQQQIRQVTVSRAYGATQVVGSGLPSTDLTLIVDSDTEALQAAQWIVFKHSDPGPRMGSATFLLHESPDAEALLAAEIGDRIAFSDVPAQMWDDAGDVVVEGWTENLTDQAWTLNCNLLPWSLFTALILDDPTYGALDAFPIMN